MVGKPDIGELPTSELGNSEVETPAGVKFSTYGLLVTRRGITTWTTAHNLFGDRCFFAVSILSRFLRHVDKAAQPAFCSKARNHCQRFLFNHEARGERSVGSCSCTRPPRPKVVSGSRAFDCHKNVQRPHSFSVAVLLTRSQHHVAPFSHFGERK